MITTIFTHVLSFLQSLWALVLRGLLYLRHRGQPPMGDIETGHVGPLEVPAAPPVIPEDVVVVDPRKIIDIEMGLGLTPMTDPTPVTTSNTLTTTGAATVIPTPLPNVEKVEKVEETKSQEPEEPEVVKKRFLEFRFPLTQLHDLPPPPSAMSMSASVDNAHEFVPSPSLHGSIWSLQKEEFINTQKEAAIRTSTPPRRKASVVVQPPVKEELVGTEKEAAPGIPSPPRRKADLAIHAPLKEETTKTSKEAAQKVPTSPPRKTNTATRNPLGDISNFPLPQMSEPKTPTRPVSIVAFTESPKSLRRIPRVKNLRSPSSSPSPPRQVFKEDPVWFKPPALAERIFERDVSPCRPTASLCEAFANFDSGSDEESECEPMQSLCNAFALDSGSDEESEDEDEHDDDYGRFDFSNVSGVSCSTAPTTPGQIFSEPSEDCSQFFSTPAPEDSFEDLLSGLEDVAAQVKGFNIRDTASLRHPGDVGVISVTTRPGPIRYVADSHHVVQEHEEIRAMSAVIEEW